MIRAKLATMAELHTIYGLEDLWDLLEIASVEAHNQAIANRARQWQT